jgi:hypothetical protein
LSRHSADAIGWVLGAVGFLLVGDAVTKLRLLHLFSR